MSVTIRGEEFTVSEHDEIVSVRESEELLQTEKLDEIKVKRVLETVVSKSFSGSRLSDLVKTVSTRERDIGVYRPLSPTSLLAGPPVDESIVLSLESSSTSSYDQVIVADTPKVASRASFSSYSSVSADSSSSSSPSSSSEQVTEIKYQEVPIREQYSRHLPLAVESVHQYEFVLPTLRPKYDVVEIPLHLPAFIEVPYPSEMMPTKVRNYAEHFSEHLSSLIENSKAGLCEVESLGKAITATEFKNLLACKKKTAQEKQAAYWARSTMTIDEKSIKSTFPNKANHNNCPCVCPI